MRGAIVVVNWNGWSDTLECLEAVLRLRGFLGPVIVVDNDSTDQSVENIEGWAAGLLDAIPESRDARIRRLVLPPIPKPIDFAVASDEDFTSLTEEAVARLQSARLTVVRAQRNGGFASGNNIGIRWAQICSNTPLSFYWLVNNDAVPEVDAYVRLCEALGNTAAAGNDGEWIAGAVLLDYFQPDTVQALGGKFWRLGSLDGHLGAGMERDSLAHLPERVAVDYPVGAALAVSDAYIQRYGSMSEDLFLYFEEIDWVLRSGGIGRAFVIPKSIVYHKGGASTGNTGRSSQRSDLADYFIVRNRILIGRKLGGIYSFAAVLVAAIAVIRRLLRGNVRQALAAVSAIREGLAAEISLRYRV